MSYMFELLPWRMFLFATARLAWFVLSLNSLWLWNKRSLFRKHFQYISVNDFQDYSNFFIRINWDQRRSQNFLSIIVCRIIPLIAKYFPLFIIHPILKKLYPSALHNFFWQFTWLLRLNSGAGEEHFTTQFWWATAQLLITGVSPNRSKPIRLQNQNLATQ